VELWLLIMLWLVIAGTAVVLLSRERMRSQAAARLNDADGAVLPESMVPGTFPWHRLLIPVAAAAAAFAATGLLQLRIPFVVAAAVIAGMLAAEALTLISDYANARLENQLADAIDLMIGAVGAGASLGAALEAAVAETKAPLRPIFEDISARIRLGDNPTGVFLRLADRVPRDSFLLFSAAMAVHWEAGGQLSPTLASVGRTLRDRMDIDRRLQSSAAQSRFSAFAVLALTWFIALIVYNNNAEQMSAFLNSSFGGWAIAVTTILQACGIIWMNAMSRPKF